MPSPMGGRRGLSRYSDAWIDELARAFKEDYNPEKKTFKFYNQSIPAVLVDIALFSGVSPDTIRKLEPIARTLAKQEPLPKREIKQAPVLEARVK